MMKILFFLMSLSLIGLAGTGSAQDVQIQLDEQGKVEYIDAKLERELGLFTEYSNFREARLFQLPDTSFVLEISYRSQEKFLRVRLPFAAPEVKNLQRKVTARLQQRTPEIVLDQSGRKKLLYGTFGLSYFFYGPAVPAVLGVDDGKSAVALYMLTNLQKKMVTAHYIWHQARSAPLADSGSCIVPMHTVRELPTSIRP